MSNTSFSSLIFSGCGCRNEIEMLSQQLWSMYFCSRAGVNIHSVGKSLKNTSHFTHWVWICNETFFDSFPTLWRTLQKYRPLVSSIYTSLLLLASAPQASFSAFYDTAKPRVRKLDLLLLWQCSSLLLQDNNVSWITVLTLFLLQMVFWQNKAYGGGKEIATGTKRARSLSHQGFWIQEKWLLFVRARRRHGQTLPDQTVGWRRLFHCPKNHLSNLARISRSLQ